VSVRAPIRLGARPAQRPPPLVPRTRRLSVLRAENFDDTIERLEIRIDPEAVDLSLAHRLDHRDRAPRFALRDIGKMDFDRGFRDRCDRCAKRVRVVRERSGVDDDPVEPVTLALNLVDQTALMVGLIRPYLEPERARLLADTPLDFVERERPVD